ncbi:MAG: hypothetical protein GX654_12455 [Desulfatiglans sp.]|nr:hypothetical protein [Desulfatiglans sp.]
MEKKGLARSLKDISRTFITAEDESTPDDPSLNFLTNPVREDRCSACVNVIEEVDGPLKCRIFSSKNEKYGVIFLKSIMPGYAKYCRYFEPLAVQEAKNKENIERAESNASQENIEYEQTITSQKNIAIKDDTNLQNSFKKMLSQHLEQGYEIVRIELEKKDEHKETACLTKTIEKVTISRKDNL